MALAKTSKLPEAILLTFYVLLALGLSAWVLQFQYFIGHDGVWYARMAENIWAGNAAALLWIRRTIMKIYKNSKYIRVCPISSSIRCIRLSLLQNNG